jgi:hypothetical protein
VRNAQDQGEQHVNNHKEPLSNKATAWMCIISIAVGLLMIVLQ